jgi:dipeptidyl aminopeptidase/acylaminoacyl peptidase
MKQLALLVAGLAAVLVLAGQLARAAVPRAAIPNDSNPYWSWDARTVAFQEETSGVNEVGVVAAGHGPAGAVGPGVPRGWRPSGTELLVETGDATTVEASDGRRLSRVNGTAATWSPDGGRIAYLRDGSLYLSDATAAHERQLFGQLGRPSADSFGPVWSPDGSEIVVATAEGLRIVEADGTGSRIVFGGTTDAVNPSWSPDGQTIAFERGDGQRWVIWFVDPFGRSPRPVTDAGYNSRFPQWSPEGSRLAFISDRQHVPGGATEYQYALYVLAVNGGAAKKIEDDVHPLTPPRWSPTGAQLAYGAGQECRRWGIYVVIPSSPQRDHRRSNLCRFVGTARNDVVNGTPYFDIMRGFAGDDRLFGGAGNDHIEGNGGNDTISAGPGDNAVFGGPGNDRITAGNGRDLLEGGPGRDTISAGGGNDRIEARDGFRDLIDCAAGNDTAEIDRFDIVRGCEHVLRP